MPSATIDSPTGSTSPDASRANRILAALDDGARERLFARGAIEPLALKTEIHLPGDALTHVYFPLSGIISILSMAGDASIEIATVGSEGVVGLGAFLGDASMPWRVIVQVPGEALRVEVEHLQREIERNGTLRLMLGRYTQALLVQVAQSAACNRLHPVDERCARWLLASHDRVDAETFPVTQEFLAQMLGVRRASVTVAAGVLQKAGMIRYSRGKVRILDRAALEAAACECYRITRDEYARLLVPPVRLERALSA